MTSDVGAKMRELRKERGITQQELADALDMTRSAIGGYEIGRRVPRLPELQKIASFLGVGLDYFGFVSKDEIFDVLMRAKDVFESESVSQDDKDKLYKELMRMYLKIDK